MEQPSYQLDIDETLGFTCDVLRDIVSYWEVKRGNRAMPARADMDPLEMSQHLGWIILTEVLGVNSLPTVTPFSRPIATLVEARVWAYPRSA